MLGIDSLGVREIARHKGDKATLDRTFSNIFIVNLALTGVMLLLLVAATLTVPQLSQHKDLMAIGAFKLIFNSLLVEWVFRGLEDFKYISLRTIIIKLFYVASVFLFVRNREDVWVYYLLSSVTVVVNALANIFFSRSKVHLVLKGLSFFPTFKSLLALGIYAILTSMYTTFNVTFLGFVSGEVEVGYYGTATKIYYFVMAVFSAFTGVMLPRMSNLASTGDMEQFKSYFHTAIDVLFAFSLPVIAWMMILAPDIVRVIAGPEFDGAIVPMMIISPLIFIVGYEQILVLQTLLPLGKDKLLLRNSTIGAAVGILLNIVLVPLFAAIGSSVVWIATECLILVLSQIAVRKEIGIGYPFRDTAHNILVYLPIAAILAACLLIPGSALLRAAVSAMCLCLYVIVYQTIIRKGALLQSLK
jgi:O-antigen/teichoic acid export membrane protein